MRWTAIALVTPNWHARPIRREELPVTEAVRFGPLPQWLKGSFDDQLAREELGEHVHDEHAFCLLADYEAPASVPGTASVSEPDSQNAHDDARTAIQTATTLLWLVKRSSFGFDKVILAEEISPDWTWREITSHDERVPLVDCSNVDLESEDFLQALALSKCLKRAKPGGTLATATNALGLALSQRSWPLRFLALWLALEGLFGPTDARETTFRLCQRIALFVAGRGEGAVELFAQVNESYRWRSKAVHGLRLQSLDADKSGQLLEATEVLVQRALRKLLTSPDLVDAFESKAREAYLDNLALT